MKPTPSSARRELERELRLRQHGHRRRELAGTRKSERDHELHQPRRPPCRGRSTRRRRAPRGRRAQHLGARRALRVRQLVVRLRRSAAGAAGSSRRARARRRRKHSATTCRYGGAIPHRNSAGIVKIVPVASDVDAEPIVCERFASRIVAPRTAAAGTARPSSPRPGSTPRRSSPTRRPRYAFAAPNTMPEHDAGGHGLERELGDGFPPCHAPPSTKTRHCTTTPRAAAVGINSVSMGFPGGSRT